MDTERLQANIFKGKLLQKERKSGVRRGKVKRSCQKSTVIKESSSVYGKIDFSINIKGEGT